MTKICLQMTELWIVRCTSFKILSSILVFPCSIFFVRGTQYWISNYIFCQFLQNLKQVHKKKRQQRAPRLQPIKKIFLAIFRDRNSVVTEMEIHRFRFESHAQMKSAVFSFPLLIFLTMWLDIQSLKIKNPFPYLLWILPFFIVCFRIYSM